MSAFGTIGFVGLGVMGEPMCGHVARKSGARVLAHDLRPDPLERLAADGVVPCASLAELVPQVELILLSLPGEREVEAVCIGEGGIAEHGRPGLTVVDLSTVPVALARRIGEAFAKRDMAFADAPVTRTHQAAVEGTLSVMVGADAALFARIEPVLRCFGTDVTHCGGVGAGQVLKLMNNMVCFQTVVALSEALAMARRAGVEDAVFLDTLAKGTADSFALRNHARKHMLPGQYPEQAYSVRYALKDLGYALKLAADTGVGTPGAEIALGRLREAEAAGFGDQYFPALFQVVGDAKS
ncbi:MAG: NAD(P)-dependent oxidoreductase [Alphaproteobacteria bacterium]|nr:NAD(P)-dependent oxidoreductase [Alphaproteobacteria bacterium]